MRLGTELVVATGLGALMGHAVDSFLGTRPWFLVLGLLFGGAAGSLNVYRAAREYEVIQEEDDSGDGASKPDKPDDLLK